MKYYSQAGEDKYIHEELIAIAAPTSQSYIEIGALDGVKYSNTKFLEESLGWSGILVEPNPKSFERLQSNRPSNILVPSLISNSEEELEYTYFENENLAAVSGATNTLTDKNKAVFFENDEEWLQNAKKNYLRSSRVKPVSFDSIVDKSDADKFGFCSIDVEGHELQVLQSFSFNVEVEIMLIEISPSDAEITDLLEKNDYRYYDTVAHNIVFLSNNYYELVQSRKFIKAA